MLAVAIQKERSEVITIDLPPSINAQVSVPVTAQTTRVLVNGKPQSSTPDEDGTRAIVTLTEAGHYDIRSR
jgi:hypothetical protein